MAQELHFHKAAIRLHMAQPPLSQAISRLESKLGFSLFTRTKREVKLTPAGSAFLKAAYSTLKELEQGVAHAGQVAKGIAGTLTVSAVSTACYEPLLSTLKRFRETFPKVQLVIKQMPSAMQVEALLAGESDIGFMRTLSVAAPNIESRLLFNEVIVMALPMDHPNAQADHIDLRDFAGEDFVFTPQALGSGYHCQLIGLCEAAGFYPNVVQEATQLHTLMGLVASGFGVALVPESIASPFLRDKVLFRKILPLAQSCNPGVGLYAGWHTDNESPLTGSFLSLLDFSDPQSVEGARAQAPERHGDQAVE